MGGLRSSNPCFFFFFNDTATTEIYTLSLHDALPISAGGSTGLDSASGLPVASPTATFPGSHRAMSLEGQDFQTDRKSTRLNSSHANISYAVFCLKKKKQTNILLPYRHDKFVRYHNIV